MHTLELEPGEYEAAVERARVRADTEPHATAARYDKRLRMVMVTLHTGLTVAFHPADVQGLEAATVADLSTIEISPSGFGLHFPAVDADVWLPGLLAGHFGSKNWMDHPLKSGASSQASSPSPTSASNFWRSNSSSSAS